MAKQILSISHLTQRCDAEGEFPLPFRVQCRALAADGAAGRNMGHSLGQFWTPRSEEVNVDHLWGYTLGNKWMQL